MYAVIGLGYVGLGLAVAIGKKEPVIGYDVSEPRVASLKKYIDQNHQVSTADLKKSDVHYTTDVNDLKNINFYIIVVSTPAYYYEFPDLTILKTATQTIGKILKQGDVVVYESTVYPGTTEEVCIPILERFSKLTYKKDFHVGYSPERINPGDNEHTLDKLTKIVAASNAATLEKLKTLYGAICKQVHPVSNIATAEAVKILENTQRDVNIAFMNEFAKIMHALNLDTHEIIEAAKTKWNFVPFKPGFVGGHCISIDPYYLAFQAKRYGASPDLIMTARRVNDGMTKFVLQSLVRLVTKACLDLETLEIGIFGITFKENINDTRNSLALKLAKELEQYGLRFKMHDPMPVNQDKLKFPLSPLETIQGLSVTIIVTGHDAYKEMGLDALLKYCKRPCIIMDIPGIFVHTSVPKEVTYWHL